MFSEPVLATGVKDPAEKTKFPFEIASGSLDSTGKTMKMKRYRCSEA